MKQLRFEWDERKSTVNRRKHGVSFEEARMVFFDESALLRPDEDLRTRKGLFCSDSARGCGRLSSATATDRATRSFG